jgi:acyl-CoA thioester hydrolase
MARIYLHRIVVGDDAIDVYRHVNNLAYLRWAQDAAIGHSAAQDWPVERYMAAGAGWFVRSHFIEYLRPAFAGDTLLLYTWVAGMTGRSSSRRYLFLRGDESGPVAKAESRWVFVDFKSARSVSIPTEVRAAFPTVPDDDPELLALTSRGGKKGHSS